MRNVSLCVLVAGLSFEVCSFGVSARCAEYYALLAKDSDMGVAGHGVRVLSPDVLLDKIDRVVNLADPKIAEDLLDLFDDHSSYLRDPLLMRQLERRAKLRGKQLFEGWNKNTIPVKEGTSTDPLLPAVAFLIAARGNIKDLVWDDSQIVRLKLTELGVAPERYSNLSNPTTVKTLLQKVKTEELLKPAALDAALETATGHRLSGFLEGDKLMNIYADEVSRTLAEKLKEAANKLPKNTPKRREMETLVKELLSAFEKDGLTFELSSRDVDGLKGGDKAGDCTACGSVNYWTQGAWNAAFENNELKVYQKGRFFARFVMVAGMNDGKPAMWIHAAEFNPQEKGRADQVEDLSKAIGYLTEHLAQSGFKALLITDISNSSKYNELLRKAMPEGSKQKTSDNFQLLDHFQSAQNVEARVIGKTESPATKVYLQGWGSDTEFSAKSIKEPNSIEGLTERFGDVEFSQHEAERMSHIVVNYQTETMNQVKLSLAETYANITSTHLELDLRENLGDISDFVNYSFDSAKFIGSAERATKMLLTLSSDAASQKEINDSLKRLQRSLAAVINADIISQDKREMKQAERALRQFPDEVGQFIAVCEKYVNLSVNDIRHTDHVEPSDVNVSFKQRLTPNIDLVDPNWKKVLQARLIEAGFSEQQSQGSVDNLPAVLAFYNRLSSRGREELPSSLSSRLQGYRIPLR